MTTSYAVRLQRISSSFWHIQITASDVWFRLSNFFPTPNPLETWKSLFLFSQKKWRVKCLILLFFDDTNLSFLAAANVEWVAE